MRLLAFLAAGACLTLASTPTRIERDTMGEVTVAADRLWGASTQRSLENFKISDDRMPDALLRAFAVQKAACARANRVDLGDQVADAIVAAAARMGEDRQLRRENFPLVVYQTGSGTQTNMNVNEVLANLANEALGAPEHGLKSPVHPNNHVNFGQSTNDSFPTAMHIAAAIETERALLPALQQLRDSLRRKEREFAAVVKIGRTHMQDATPLTVGQEFSSWASQLDMSMKRIREAVADVLVLPQGGTAVGTGLNTDEEFATRFVSHVRTATSLPFSAAENRFEAGIASHDALTHLSGALNTAATSLIKVANDVRLLGSGPKNGLGELVLPANEPGSSIMPGKVNPTQSEALSMAAAAVMGNHVAVTVGNSHGHLQLNAFKPIIIFKVLDSIRLLGDGARSFDDNCVSGIALNKPRIAEHVEQNLMLVTALNPIVGYDKAAAIAKHALAANLTLKQSAEAHGVDSKTFDEVIVPGDMVAPRKLSEQEKKERREEL